MTENEIILKAIEVLQKGGIILYPTDTIWGIGCDATNATAIEKVYRIKKRSESKSLIILVESIDQIYKYVDEMPQAALRLIKDTKKPLTIIYDNAKNLPLSLIAVDGSVAIRIVQEEFCKELILQFKKPLVSTSANISGEPSPASFKDISGEIKNEV